jgi:hypothetical protein
VGLASWWFFSRNRDARLKRRVLVRGQIGSAVLFLGFALAVGIPPSFLLIMLPAVALIFFLNWHLTRFCASCGATLYNYDWFTRMRFCSSCGAPLTEPGRR